MTHLNIANVEKRFGSTVAVDRVSLELEQGEIVCLLGPSGCGKTTLLRLVAGLETADGGSIVLNGRNLVDVPTYQRGTGMMFQSYALFPHMTVAENIAYGLKMAGEPEPLIRERVNEMLNLVDLQGLDQRRIDQLSGGQQQRVALARSLATRPGILLLDEPLGSLDRLLRERLLGQLRAILKKVGVTALYVTHDQSEAFGIADRVAVMNNGQIEQVAEPQEIYTRPTSRFVASFLGLSNVVASDKWQVASGSQFDQLASRWLDGKLTDETSILIPPYSARLEEEVGLWPISVTVNSYSFRGRFALLNCRWGQYELEFSLDPFGGQHLIGRVFEAGEQVDLWLDPHYFVLLKD
ncbi:MAG: ABC-type Fe3+/spermidine/putrescine transport system ATPase subunit [Cellvibrionaceae bacterium]|jgi:ABC-type Fe3+/spermidine/putrescine transport system ATPase subunit